jgi:hypothetical protein
MASADTRTPDTDALRVLGCIIDHTVKRDAIHIAVEPVTAAEELKPGCPIGLLEDGTAVAAPHGGDRHSGMTTRHALGVVDPYLKCNVRKGERFLMLLNPGQISTLRHVWDHPAFAPSDVALAAPEQTAPAGSDSRSAHFEAMLWLRNFARDAGVPYDDMISDAMRWSTTDDEPWWINHYHSYDEFWDKMDALLGTKLARGTIDFSCRGCD